MIRKPNIDSVYTIRAHQAEQCRKTSSSDISRFRDMSRFRKSEPLFRVLTTHPESANDSDQVPGHFIGNLALRLERWGSGDDTFVGFGLM